MRVVLDTSALIYLNDFRNFDEMITCDDVVMEVKDKTSRMKLSTLNLKIVEPKKETLDEIEQAAKETGDLEKLSQTDLKVLGLAKESGSIIISDDRNIQNVAEKLGIEYISLFNKKITKLMNWKKFCKNCKKFFESENVCPICGEELSRISVRSKDIIKN